MARQQFDVIVVGTGVSGATAAYECRNAGQNVAIIDYRPFGGTCVLRGCDAKKVLVTVAEAADFHNRMLGKGLQGEPKTIDWPQVIAFKRSFTDPMPEKLAKSFEEEGIKTFHGMTRFVSERELGLNGDTLEARNFVIASGSKPMDLGMPGSDLVITSEQFLELNDLPPRVVFIGGGFISFEFSHLANLAGSEAIILDRGKRPLTPFDPDLVWDLVKATRDKGIQVNTERAVEKVEKISGEFHITVKTPDGQEEVYRADLVVHGAGRVPQTEELHLEAAAVEAGRKGIKVNEYLQSVSNSSVYAIGDAAEMGPQLTPVGVYEGEIAAENICQGNTKAYEHPPIPSIVFTTPPLGAVGMLEDEVRARNFNYRISQANSSSWYNSRRLQERYASYKTIIDRDSDRILGAHILGPAAEELTNLFASAIKNGVTAQELKSTIFAYPTFSYDVRYML